MEFCHVAPINSKMNTPHLRISELLYTYHRQAVGY
jgi:hypothetical protein